MRFPRQEYWSGLPFPSPGGLPNPGIEPGLLSVSCISGKFFYHWATGEARINKFHYWQVRAGEGKVNRQYFRFWLVDWRLKIALLSTFQDSMKWHYICVYVSKQHHRWLEKEMTTRSSILTGESHGEEPLQSTGLQRVRRTTDIVGT